MCESCYSQFYAEINSSRLTRNLQYMVYVDFYVLLIFLLNFQFKTKKSPLPPSWVWKPPSGNSKQTFF